MSTRFWGSIRWIAGPDVPAGWAACDGQLLAISSYPALYSLLGTQFGGNGVTNFALPDLRGRTPMGLADNTQVGWEEGERAVRLSQAQMPPHTHTIPVSDHRATSGDPGTGHAILAGGSRAFASAADAQMDSSAVSIAGGEEHENMQPYLVLQAIISLGGQFPERP